MASEIMQESIVLRDLRRGEDRGIVALTAIIPWSAIIPTYRVQVSREERPNP